MNTVRLSLLLAAALTLGQPMLASAAAKPEAKPAQKAAVKPVAKADTKPETKPVAKSEAKALAPIPAPAPAPAAASEPLSGDPVMLGEYGDGETLISVGQSYEEAPIGITVTIWPKRASYCTYLGSADVLPTQTQAIIKEFRSMPDPLHPHPCTLVLNADGKTARITGISNSCQNLCGEGSKLFDFANKTFKRLKD